MKQSKTKKERFTDYINSMTFSEVIEFFNFMVKDIECIENHIMYDYHMTDDAIIMIQKMGIKDFYRLISKPQEKERCMMVCEVDGKIEHCTVNPWDKIISCYTNWFIEHVEECMAANTPSMHSIMVRYPKLLDVVCEPKIKVKVAVHKTLTRIVEVEARTRAEAEEWIAKNF